MDTKPWLINEYKCGCQIHNDGSVVYTIKYCPLHNSAEDLYEALKGLINQTKFDSGLSTEMIKAHEALAKAEGK